jgi:hypothetical protein
MQPWRWRRSSLSAFSLSLSALVLLLVCALCSAITSARFLVTIAFPWAKSVLSFFLSWVNRGHFFSSAFARWRDFPQYRQSGTHLFSSVPLLILLSLMHTHTHTLSLSVSLCVPLSLFLKKIIKKLSFLLLWPACFFSAIHQEEFLLCLFLLKEKLKIKMLSFLLFWPVCLCLQFMRSFLGGIRKDVFRGFWYVLCAPLQCFIVSSISWGWCAGNLGKNLGGRGGKWTGESIVKLRCVYLARHCGFCGQELQSCLMSSVANQDV